MSKKMWRYALPVVVLAFFALGFLLAPNDPTQTHAMDKFLPPSLQFPFGTDEFGRCEFSRILAGGRTTLGIVLVGSALVIVFGLCFGMLLAKRGGRRNLFAESLLNAVTAIPPVAYLIIFIGIWGNSIPTMLVALTASLLLRMTRLVKTLVEVESEKAYVLCAICCGAGRLRILLVHILPNILRGNDHCHLRLFLHRALSRRQCHRLGRDAFRCACAGRCASVAIVLPDGLHFCECAVFQRAGQTARKGR